MTDPVLSLRGLKVDFRTLNGDVHAVRGVDLDVAPGEMVGVVGESGSGKSVTFLGMLGLLPKSARISGSATVLNPNIPPKGKQTEISVPTVDLNKAWRDHAGDMPVDVLKVDVEGFELKVLETIPDLLKRTNSVVLEWHKWITPRQPVDDVLAQAGLRFVKVVTEDPHCGVAFYERDPRL